MDRLKYQEVGRMKKDEYDDTKNETLIFIERSVESKSRAGIFHGVVVYRDGSAECDCESFIMRRRCRPR